MKPAAIFSLSILTAGLLFASTGVSRADNADDQQNAALLAAAQAELKEAQKWADAATATQNAIAATNESASSNASGSTHHTMTELTEQSLRADPSDPTHHTMTELANQNLRDQSNTNHHSMSDLLL